MSRTSRVKCVFKNTESLAAWQTSQAYATHSDEQFNATQAGGELFEPDEEVRIHSCRRVLHLIYVFGACVAPYGTKRFAFILVGV